MAATRTLACDWRATPRYRGPRPAISRTHGVRHDPSESPEPFQPTRELAFVRAVRAGVATAVATFQERLLCVPRYLAVLNRRRGYALDEHDLNDLVSSAVLIALTKLGEYQAHAPLEGWLCRLCHFEFLNALRRRARERRRNAPLPEEDDVEAAAGPDRHAHDEVHRALERLGGVEAEVVRLKHFDGLTFAEIGARLGMPPNTAKTRYHRGLDKLARILQALRAREDGKEEN